MVQNGRDETEIVVTDGSGINDEIKAAAGTNCAPEIIHHPARNYDNENLKVAISRKIL